MFSVISERGHELKVVEGYKLKKDKMIRAGQRWRCSDKRCNASMVTDRDSGALLTKFLMHNHPPPKNLHRKAVSNAAKKIAVEHRSAKAKEVIESVLSTIPKDFLREITNQDLNRMQSNIYNARRTTRPQQGKNQEQVHETEELVSVHSLQECIKERSADVGAGSFNGAVPTIPFVEVKEEPSEELSWDGSSCAAEPGAWAGSASPAPHPACAAEPGAWAGSASPAPHPACAAEPGAWAGSASPAPHPAHAGLAEEFRSTGDNVTRKLLRMQPTQAIYAESIIANVLRRGLLGTLQEQTDICDEGCGRREAVGALVQPSGSTQAQTANLPPPVKDEMDHSL